MKERRFRIGLLLIAVAVMLIGYATSAIFPSNNLLLLRNTSHAAITTTNVLLNGNLIAPSIEIAASHTAQLSVPRMANRTDFSVTLDGKLHQCILNDLDGPCVFEIAISNAGIKCLPCEAKLIR